VARSRAVRTYWIGVLLIVALGPVALVVAVDHAHFRNTTTALSVVTGMLAASLFVVTFALPTRVPSVLSAFGIERVLRTHRLLAVSAVALLVLHIGLAVIGDPRHLHIFVLTDQPRPVWAAMASTFAVALLIITAIRRRQTQPRYEGWRLLHIGLALTALAFAALHIVWLGAFDSQFGRRFSYAILAEAAVFIVIRRWVWLPMRSGRRSYFVDGVTPVSGNAVTVTVRAHGHAGLPFRAGQFAWLKIGSSPFVFEEHPFTIASTAERPDVKVFTIKALGDFSELLSGLRPGRRVYLDGPYGRFTVDGVRSTGFVFIAGGVGVTPMMSILQTLADRGDTADHLLIVGARRVEDVIMRAEFEALRPLLALDIVEVIEEPPPGWTGEVGRVDAGLLDRALPRRARHRDYYVCGPPRMVVAVGQLLRARGIAPRRIHTEQFEVV
jgi:predicted ferric reductase